MAGKFLGSVVNRIFGAAPEGQANQQVSNDPNKNTPNQSGESSNKTAPNGSVPEGSGKGDGTSPTDKFHKLWETTPDDPNKKQQEPEGLTPQEMLAAAAKVDFAKVIDKELLAKISAGGEEATSALVQALNRVSQQTYAQSTLVADKLISAQVAKAKLEFVQQVPDIVKRQRVQDDLIKDNPAFKDPAVVPVVALIQNQLAEKYPTATADEIRTMAVEYFTGAAQKLSPPKKTGTSSASKENTDDNWEEWLTK